MRYLGEERNQTAKPANEKLPPPVIKVCAGLRVGWSKSLKKLPVSCLYPDIVCIFVVKTKMYGILKMFVHMRVEVPVFSGV